ncbi:cellulose synthase/poly-beta-1,6-N-acetylglucosamine synthase-like glycosyltransferase [Bacillus tianshenii]|uniref:Cellulose synthase/poly-beta-1,6-N-acetylglucosamine synthase-like glycosyltransferase n=1 Tax=Sutcliffiella tianshenii TaxID=1463404 RepID=A0ABS2P146_9BACI|nr:glycosyltransferase family 2 protein [Bacillus tianshenii]MBM7620680.1 cellulose synthase/poly-beta-1,6-N-acetylglucosamine synthase-like glycosyltransferase [Bacillus tianshenii]
MEQLAILLSGFLLLSLIGMMINGLFFPRFHKPIPHYTPLVSIMVPMRDEERNVVPLIQNLQKLSYPNVEFILLDDHSSDSTLALAQGQTQNDNRFRLIEGVALKKGWAGKVHACHQLSGHASGEFLLFLDADARLKPDTIENMLPFFEKGTSHLVTGFPRFPVTSLLSKLLVPMQHFVTWLHLPLPLANYSAYKQATAAHGAFMFFERNAYLAVGGHSAVKDSIVEDVHLARVMKQHGFTVKLINPTGYVTCHMYETNEEVWYGFLKNIYIGIGRSPWIVAGLTVFYSVFYFLPLPLALLAPIYGNWLFLPLLLVWIQKLYIDLQTKQKAYLCLLMPLSVLAFIVLMHASMWKSLKKEHYLWKGRAYK